MAGMRSRRDVSRDSPDPCLTRGATIRHTRSAFEALQGRRRSTKSLSEGGWPRSPSWRLTSAPLRLQFKLGFITPSQQNTGPDPTRSEGANRAWVTRRANRFHANIKLLTRVNSPGREELLAAAHEVAEQIAANLDDGSVLPRGYRVAKNGWGDRGLAWGEVLFNGCHTAPAPSREALEQLASDLRTGWLREVAQATGKPIDFSLPQERAK